MSQQLNNIFIMRGHQSDEQDQNDDRMMLLEHLEALRNNQCKISTDQFNFNSQKQELLLPSDINAASGFLLFGSSVNTRSNDYQPDHKKEAKKCCIM